LLKSWLQLHGHEVRVRDLNWESGLRAGVGLPAAAARRACTTPLLESMNEPFFAAEDVLMERAARYGGIWNAQLGFEYAGAPHESSGEALASLDRPSPFDGLFDEVVREAVAESPGLIGFSVAAVQQVIPTLQLCARLRRAGFPGRIVLGGNTVSRLVEEMAIPAVFDLVDGLLTFEGEMPLLRLCDAVAAGSSFASVPHLAWRDGTEMRRNNHDERLDPDALTAPDFSDLAVGRYWGENYLTLVGARGCYYGKCNFCAIPYGWGHNGYAGTRTVDRVYQDMLALIERHDINRFKFVDEALSPRFMRELANRILAGGLIVEWEGYTRLEAAWHDPDFVDLVGRAGFRKGYFGLELLPAPGRTALNKHDHADPERLLDLCAASGVKVHLFCMFGYPGTGEAEAARTVEFLLNHRHLVDTADIFAWGYAKHTSVTGAEPMRDARRDWGLEFDYVATRSDTLSRSAVEALASKYEELIWAEVPRFVHPTYRLISPWSQQSPAKAPDAYAAERVPA